jgi:hypothetical protein
VVLLVKVLGLEADDGVTIEIQKKADAPYLFLRLRKDHIALIEITSSGVKLKKDLPNVSTIYSYFKNDQHFLYL